MAEASRRTTSRRDLSRQRRFDEVSPEIGELDEDAFETAMDDDPDAALTLLAELTGATDERLRLLARRLAGRVIVDLARVGVARRRGVGRIDRDRARSAVGDVDLDASVDAIVDARAARRAPNLDDLTVQTWRRPDTALCLLVDRSGSMLGARLAAAAVAAAAVVYRHGHDCSVVAFSDEAIVLKSQDAPRSADELVGDLLRLRGHGTTDVGLAVRTARAQLARSTAGRRVAVLLSDCRPTTGGDPTADAAKLDELAILAPDGDLADAQALADAIGGRCVSLAGPAHVPDALAEVLLG
ncbi:MAG TPA: vWA domain-containing protein [Microthrixaceae bacterium]|nr:vWA domain-containing protein [Microthrixaceae bacterium]